jgi:hypothetical protein
MKNHTGNTNNHQSINLIKPMNTSFDNLINGGDFTGTVNDYLHYWPHSENLKDPTNGWVEINIGGHLG